MRKTKLAQISDPHVCEQHRPFEGRDTAQLLQNAVDAACSRAPDALLLTGDLVACGTREEYARLKDCLGGVSPPVYLVVGNHDDRGVLREVLASHAYLPGGDFIQYQVRIGELRLIVLDTQTAGSGEGELCDRRLEWLAGELASDPTTPTVIAMHHPPFRTYIDPMDRYGLVRGAKAFEELVARHGNIERIVCGHVHRTIFKRFAGTIASTCPSSAVPVALDLAEGARFGWGEDAAAFQLHVWTPADGLVTHVADV